MDRIHRRQISARPFLRPACFRDRIFKKPFRCYLPTKIMPLLIRIRTVILKMKGKKNEKPKIIARFTKIKSEKIAEKENM